MVITMNPTIATKSITSPIGSHTWSGASNNPSGVLEFNREDIMASSVVE
jgi:hypothetical protein